MVYTEFSEVRHMLIRRCESLEVTGRLVFEWVNQKVVSGVLSLASFGREGLQPVG